MLLALVRVVSLGSEPLCLVTLFYCLIFEISLFVASYDSQGHGGGIRPSLHKVKVTLRLTIFQSVHLAHDHICISLLQLRSCFCGAPSLTRGRVCVLYMLLALASAVFLGSKSLGTRGHIILSQIWGFHFRRLLRLAGSRWRYSIPPPHGSVSTKYFYRYTFL
jgi:hypothetical protein